jgi:hypothetical protein
LTRTGPPSYLIPLLIVDILHMPFSNSWLLTVRCRFFMIWRTLSSAFRSMKLVALNATGACNYVQLPATAERCCNCYPEGNVMKAVRRSDICLPLTLCELTERYMYQCRVLNHLPFAWFMIPKD